MLLVLQLLLLILKLVGIGMLLLHCCGALLLDNFIDLPCKLDDLAAQFLVLLDKSLTGIYLCGLAPSMRGHCYIKYNRVAPAKTIVGGLDNCSNEALFNRFSSLIISWGGSQNCTIPAG